MSSTALNALVNYDQPSQAIVTSLVYELYGVTIPANAVWSAPLAYFPILEDTYQRDTAVTLTMPDGSVGVTGQATIRYSRISLATLSTGNSFPLSMETVPFTTEELLPQINYTYGLALTMDDVLNTTYTNPHGPFPLTAAPGSFAWKGILDLDVELESSGEHESTGEHHSS
jgi:hypothetical protein